MWLGDSAVLCIWKYNDTIFVFYVSTVWCRVVICSSRRGRTSL